jgi:hypothetical protein
MYNSGSSEKARALIAAIYEKLTQAFDDGLVPIFALQTPEYSPCYLAGTYTLSDVYYAVDLIYGSRDSAQEHIRVTTWRNVPGQDFEPESPLEVNSMTPEHQEIRVGDRVIPAAAYHHADAWRLNLSIDDLHILISGRGLQGDLTLEPLRDIAPAVEAGKAYVQKDFR